MRRIIVAIVMVIGVVAASVWVNFVWKMRADSIPAVPKVQTQESSAADAIKAVSLPDESSVQSLPRPKSFTLNKAEKSVIEALLDSYLNYIDYDTRYGCGEKNHPRYFPQHPKLVLMYKGGGFMPEFWKDLKMSTRRWAPAVTLLSHEEVVPEAYLIDVMDVKTTTPVALVTYRQDRKSVV